MPADLRAALRRVLPGALLVLCTVGAAAQDSIPRRPVPADTLRRPRPDSVRVPIPEEAIRADTLPDAAGDTAQADTVTPDSAIRAPAFPDYPQPGAVGFGPGVWVWTAAELARWHGLSLEDFFDRIPGLVVTRSGSFARPAGVSPYGAGGGRLRIFLDGWELRAMNGGTPDLQRVPLADVVGLRVERRLGEVRVDVATFRLRDRRPYAQIEGADGDFDTRILRPFFATAIGDRFALQVGLDLVETQGFRRAEDFGANTPFARLTYEFRPDLALQLDYRGTAWSLDPVAGSNIPGEHLDRSEVMLRGRGRFGSLWLDGAIGRSGQKPADGDTLVVDLQSTQAYLRGLLPLGPLALTGGARLHQGDDDTWAPDERELSVGASFDPGGGVNAGGELRHRTRAGEGGLELEGWARAALVGPLALFGNVASGDRPISFRRDSTRVVGTVGGGGGLPGAPLLDTIPATFFLVDVPSLSAVRAGAEWTRGSWALGAAYVVHDLARAVPYGTYLDAGIPPVDGGSVTGVEGYGSIPFLLHGLRVEGWFMKRLDDVRRPYLPDYFGRAALEFHDVFRDGNLEPTLRVEVVGRSRTPLPSANPGEELEAPRYGIANAFVQIRILDIRLFWRMENVFNNRSALDVAGTRLPGARQMYGVRWFFRN